MSKTPRKISKHETEDYLMDKRHYERSKWTSMVHFSVSEYSF